MFQLIVIFTTFLLLYITGTKNHSYWKRRGVKYTNPVPYLGSIWEVLMQRMSMSEFVVDLYRKYPEEKFVGMFEGSKISLLVRDVELVKAILITDFESFHDRGIVTHVDLKEPLLKNLGMVDGDYWKLIRKRMSPAFTSSKLKAMFPLFVEKTTKLQHATFKLTEKSDLIDVSDLMAKYTIDNIAASAFGIESDAFSEEDSVFRQLGKRIFTITKRDMSVLILKLLAPNLFKNIYLLSPEIEKNIRYLVQKVISERNYRCSGRNDFIDLLLELKEMGKLSEPSFDKKNPDGSPAIVELEMDESFMVAQVYGFYGAGFETSSNTASFTLNQLAFHPECQRQCQEEVDEVLKRHGNKITYEAVKEMKYLDMCFKESMRITPALGVITRKCTKMYNFPGTDLTIDPGVGINISIQGLHNDERYFPEPEKFLPERFHPANKNFCKDAYMPFGGGPRSCIAERLGTMQALAGLCAILSKFSVEPAKESQQHPELAADSFLVQSPKARLQLRLVRRQ